MSASALWSEVILQALRDATTGNVSGTDSVRQIDRARARHWFRSTSRDFIEVCCLAGLDPEATAERARLAIQRFDDAIASGKPFQLLPDSNCAKPHATRVHRDPNPTPRPLSPRKPNRRFNRPVGRKAQLYFKSGIGKSLTQWSIETDIPYRTLSMRVRSGMTITEAINRTLKPKGKQHVIGGVSKTIAEWAAHVGTTSNNLHARMRNGRSLSDAVAMSPGRSNRGRGRGLDFAGSLGTGGGPTAQESANLEISE